jgi:hypothetical protein
VRDGAININLKSIRKPALINIEDDFNDIFVIDFLQHLICRIQTIHAPKSIILLIIRKILIFSSNTLKLIVKLLFVIAYSLKLLSKF